MRKTISICLIMCFWFSLPGIVWAIPGSKTPIVDEVFIEALLDSITSIKENVIMVDYDVMHMVVESYVEALPKLKIPKPKKKFKDPVYPDVKIEMTGTYNWNFPQYPDDHYICNGADLVGKQITFTFEAADTESQSVMDAYPTIYDIPDPMSDVQVVAAIRVDDDLVISGNPFVLSGHYGIKIYFYNEETEEWELKSTKIVTSGARTDIFIGFDNTIYTAKEKLLSLQEELSYLNPEDNLPDETIDNFLDTLNSFYFALADHYRNYVTSLMDVTCTKTLSIGYATRNVKRYRDYLTMRLTPGAIQLDVPVIGTKVEGPDKLRWYQVFGGIATNLESFTIEVITGMVASSTGRVFAEAIKQGVPLYTIDPEDPSDTEVLMRELELGYNIENIIRGYVNDFYEDYLVVTPRTLININGANVAGLVIYNKNTGQSGYVIGGGINGFISGGATTNPFDGTSGDILAEIWKGIEVLDAIIIGATSSIAGGVHIYGGLLIADAFAGLPGAAVAVGFGGLGVAMGTLIAGLGIIITLQLINNMYFSCVLTTRRGYYV